MEHQPPPFFNRGPSALTRLLLIAAVSIVMMLADARFHHLNAIRTTLSVALYPLQRSAASPLALVERISDFFVTQARLQSQNEEFRQARLEEAAQLLRTQALQAENTHLRKLLGAKQRFGESALVAQIIYAGHDPFTRKVLIDKGEYHHIKLGQAVIDDAGVVGQVTRVMPLSSEVTLLTDKGQAIPVELVRNGLRGIVFGYGQDGALEIRYMAGNSDIQNGDVLVTSGIDGTYPAGLPVAVVSKIERNVTDAFAKIICTPSAGVDRNKELLVLIQAPQPRDLPPRPVASPVKPPAKKN